MISIMIDMINIA